jgi:hypothetical protein
MKARIALVLIVIVFFAVSSFSASARSLMSDVHSDVRKELGLQATMAATEAAFKCADQSLINRINDDVNAIMGSRPKDTDPKALYAFLVKVSKVRHTYDEMPTPPDLGCSTLVNEIVSLLTDIQDIGLAHMGKALGIDTAEDMSENLAELKDQWVKLSNTMKASDPKFNVGDPSLGMTGPRSCLVEPFDPICADPNDPTVPNGLVE